MDRLGTRTGTAVFVIWWSLANIVTAWAQGVRSMGACRSMLGLGEAGIWPAASKAVSEWFPARERALAIGLYTMGATIGATVAPSTRRSPSPACRNHRRISASTASNSGFPNADRMASILR